jgi:hypothetical protein
MPKQTLIKVEEAKWRKRAPHQRKRRPSSASNTNMDRQQHGITRPSSKRAPALSPRFKDVVPLGDGTLALELESMSIAKVPKKKRFRARSPWGRPPFGKRLSRIKRTTLQPPIDKESEAPKATPSRRKQRQGIVAAPFGKPE